jgi:hypothetical protein
MLDGDAALWDAADASQVGRDCRVSTCIVNQNQVTMAGVAQDGLKAPLQWGQPVEHGDNNVYRGMPNSQALGLAL